MNGNNVALIRTCRSLVGFLCPGLLVQISVPAFFYALNETGGRYLINLATLPCSDLSQRFSVSAAHSVKQV